MIYLGIDLGTSNSCIAYYNSQNGSYGVVKPPQVDELALKGGNVTPTAVALDKEGHLFAAGYFANACSQVMGSHLIDKVKLWIGRPYNEVSQDSRLQNLTYTLVPAGDGASEVQQGSMHYSAGDIISYYLKFLISEAYLTLKTTLDFRHEEVTLIVTYPAYYVQNQVDAIRDAVYKTIDKINSSSDTAEHLVIKGVRLIPEPLATICAGIYEKKLGTADKYVLVIDEGAGTLDVMLVNLEESKVSRITDADDPVIEATGITIGGMERLGGVDMDNMILTWVGDQLRAQAIELSTLNPFEQKQLLATIEDAKISLAMGRTSEAQIGIPHYSTVIRLTKDQLKEIVMPCIDLCKKHIDKAIEEIEKSNEGFSRAQISKVILIGGPTQMPVFREKIYESIPVDPLDNINAMEYVALGAALSPAIRYKVPVERAYGLLRREDGMEKFDKIVEKGTLLPFHTIIEHRSDQYDNKITIEVAQVYDENDIEIICKKMGKYEYLIPPQSKDYSIIFEIDEERKISIIITESRDQANNYLEGKRDDPFFRLQFFRESAAAPAIVSKLPGSYIDPVKVRAFHIGAPIIFEYLRTGNDKIMIAGSVLRYNLPPEKRERIEDLRTQIEILIKEIYAEGNYLLDRIEVDGDHVTAESETMITEWCEKIRESRDFTNLAKKIYLIDHEFNDIDEELTYSPDMVAELLEKIKTTEEQGLKLFKNKGSKIPEGRVGEAMEIIKSLGIIRSQLNTEKNEEIPVNSQKGSTFREGAHKEQMLKSMINQYSQGCVL